MSEHLLFLQAAGTDFGTAHELVAAVADIVRAQREEPTSEEKCLLRSPITGLNQGSARSLDPDRIVDRIARGGCEGTESLIIALSVLTTIASPLRDVDADWIVSIADRIGNENLLLESAGVVFAFNTINRIADARRVRLECGFLRQWKPIQGWVERGFALVAGLAYDLSIKHHARQSTAELQGRVGAMFDRLGVPVVPEVFCWLSRSSVVLEGVLEMLDVNVTHAQVSTDLLKDAVAIGVVSRSMPDSSLRSAFEKWLPREALRDSRALRAWAIPPGAKGTPDLVSACRRYAWRVANAAYTITDEQISELLALGLTDAELLDLTLATSAFSALAIIEPISRAVVSGSVAAETAVSSIQNHPGTSSIGLKQEIAV